MRVNAVEGRGPGQHLSRRLAEPIGGAPHCHSAPGERCAFVLIVEDPWTMAIRILIAEDHADSLDPMRRLLPPSGAGRDGA